MCGVERPYAAGCAEYVLKSSPCTPQAVVTVRWLTFQGSLRQHRRPWLGRQRRRTGAEPMILPDRNAGTVPSKRDVGGGCQAAEDARLGTPMDQSEPTRSESGWLSLPTTNHAPHGHFSNARTCRSTAADPTSLKSSTVCSSYARSGSIRRAWTGTSSPARHKIQAVLTSCGKGMCLRSLRPQSVPCRSCGRLYATQLRWFSESTPSYTSNGDFDTYWTWHLQQEQQRVHHARYHNPCTLTPYQAPGLDPETGVP